MPKSRFDTTVLSKAHVDELFTELSGRVPEIRSDVVAWCNVSDALKKAFNREVKKYATVLKKRGVKSV